MIKKPTIKDFYIVTYVEWKEIERVLGKREYKKFTKWMIGQTVSNEGAYPWDLEKYLRIRFEGKKDVLWD